MSAVEAVHLVSAGVPWRLSLARDGRGSRVLTNDS